MSAREIIERALSATTLDQAERLQATIAVVVGGRYERPLGDKWNNFGLMSHAGDYDHKLIENVTNAQDAILERAAAGRFWPLDQVPYRSPHEAAQGLIDDPTDAVVQRIGVEIRDPGALDLADKRITFVVRDDGCGMTPEDLPRTLLQLGSGHKSDRLWQQGAFGLGAKSTFRNARAVVVVSRRAPEMHPAEDRISVAVVLWSEFGKGIAAYYLTTTDWDDGANPDAVPWSAPASEYPEFEPGTHVALISYQVRGLHRRFSGDERAFQAIAQTRLHNPVLPFRQTSYLVAKAEPRTVRGLAHQLAANPQPDRRHGYETLPFHLDGTTYQLPVSWWVFPAPADKAGGRNSVVAARHVVAFTSAGQVHHHWDQAQFKDHTKLRKLDGRIYVVVETDALPITLRTRLFTPDRSALLPNDSSLKLEAAVAAFLDDSDELLELDAALLRTEIEQSLGTRSTRTLAQRISRAFRMRGFATANGNGAPRRTKPRRRGRPRNFELYPEPTMIEGPEHATLRPGDTRSLVYWINAEDGFIGCHRGELRVSCDHPDIGAREIAIGEPRGGRLRVTLVVPDTAELGDYTIVATIPEWPKAAGGLAGPLRWETKLTITDAPPAAPRTRDANGAAAAEGGEIALLWAHGDTRGWPTNLPGKLEEIPAAELARRDEYKDLARLGDTDIATIVLNEDYRDLKKYVQRLTGKRQGSTVDRVQDRYAQGVGVGLLVLQEREKQTPLDDEARALATQAIARSTLSLLPAFDELMTKIGYDGAEPE